MSKPSASKKRGQSSESRATRPASDRTIYFAFLVIGLFIVLLAVPLTDGRNWGAFAVGYVVVFAWLVNVYAFKAYRGKHLANWQSALARLPLRCAGFGGKEGHGGKPLTAAAGESAAMKWIGISIAVSVVLVLILTWLLVPETRELI